MHIPKTGCFIKYVSTVELRANIYNCIKNGAVINVHEKKKVSR